MNKSMFCCFNPRLPCGRRRRRPRRSIRRSSKRFNPRLPCGRRRLKTIEMEPMPKVSIHASHAGGDVVVRTAVGWSASFQSTPPMREATSAADSCLHQRHSFNPRLPCGRRLADCGGFRPSQDVSIHASHAGGDYGRAGQDELAQGFNPRLPCGRRLTW